MIHIRRKHEREGPVYPPRTRKVSEQLIESRQAFKIIEERLRLQVGISKILSLLSMRAVDHLT
ncbi:MAG: hypothetical protein K0Q73_6326 [Paenibacillus sp.]|jgi:hypothetical protein|nr:hypothetical protein [Paenibacillus sp.]